MNIISKFSASLLAFCVVACAPEKEAPTPATPEPEAEAPEAVVETTPTPEAVETSEEVSIPGKVVPFTLGSLDAFALIDGGFTMPIAQSPFAAAQTVEAISAALEEAGLDSQSLSLSLHPLVVKAPEGFLLFDTGTGGPPAGGLLNSLEEAGIYPAAITDIFISHSHFDHVGGLAKDGALVFPNATIHMTAAEWDYMKSNNEQFAIVSAIEAAVETFEPGSELVPGIVTAVPVEGHTPGHSAYRLTSGDERMLYVGDAMHHYVISVGHPGWKIAFDTNEPAARAAREALLAELAETGESIYAYHFPFPGVGHIEVSGDSFVYVED